MDKRRIVLLMGLVILLQAQGAFALDVELFTKEDCGPCDNLRGYLQSLEVRIPSIDIIEYNQTYKDGADFGYFEEVAARRGFEPNMIPALVTGDSYHIGFKNDESERELIRTIIFKEIESEKAVDPKEDYDATLMLFWSEGCSHCAAEKRFLSEIEDKYPRLSIEMYEVPNNKENTQKLIEISKDLGFSVGSVPVTIIGDWYHIGYGSDGYDGEKIERQIKIELGLIDGINGSDSGLVVELPFFGKVDLEDMGVPLSTVVIGFVDGFNPCAFFVLIMLLSLMAYAKSRRRMLLIGLTFVTISGIVYFMFMTAIFSVIRAINEIRLLAIVGGVIALGIGAFNLKDFFFFKRGPSLSIPDDKKPALYKRMRGLLKKESTVAVITGTIVLAFVANSYELLCTAGLPLVYGNLLNSQQLDAMTSVFYIALYNVFYVLPLLTIVLLFVRSFGSKKAGAKEGKKMSEEEGEILKGISGFMMLGFGIFLIVSPTILQNIFVTGGLIVLAIVASFGLSKLKRGMRKETKEHGEERGEKEEGNNAAEKIGAADKISGEVPKDE